MRFGTGHRFGAARGGGGNGGGGAAAAWWPTPDTPVSAYMVGADEEATIPTLGDDSGGGNRLTSNTYVHDPGFSASGMGGSEPVASFVRAGGYEDLTCSSAAAHNHLHQDAQHSFVARFRTSTFVVNNQVILSTRGGNASGNGGVLKWWFSGVDGVTGAKLEWKEYNAGTAVLTLTGTVGCLPENTNADVVLRVDTSASPQAELWLNGTLVASGDYSGSQSASDASGGLVVGLRATSNSDGYSPAMQFQALATYDRWLTDDERDAWFAGSYSVGSQRKTISTCHFGDSITTTTYNYRGHNWAHIVDTADLRIKPGGAYSSVLPDDFPLGNLRHDGYSGQTLEQITARIEAFAAANPGYLYDYGVLLGGTNNMPYGAAAGIAALPDAIDAMLTIAQTVLVCTIPYGLGGSPAFTEAGDAGTYNAAIPGIVASKGSRVILVDIHQGPDAYVPATDAADNTGHTTESGAECIGAHVAAALIAAEAA